MNVLYYINYNAPPIKTFPNLSMPPVEHIYLHGKSKNKPEIDIKKGINEIGFLSYNKDYYELYNIQQALYRNTSCVYRLLCMTLLSLEKAFNPNTYNVDYSEISSPMLGMLSASDFNGINGENLSSYMIYMEESLIKIHATLLNIYNTRTATAAYNLRSHFSITPPNYRLKSLSKYKMSDFITEHHLSHRIRIYQMLTANPIAFKYLFLDGHVESKRISNNKIRIYFSRANMKPTNYVPTRYEFSLNVKGIGLLYQTFLSAILHDAMPNYARPDDISQRHLAINTLCTIIVMELLLIHWDHLSKYLQFYYNQDQGVYTFCKLLSDLSKQMEDNNTTISQRLFNMHVQLMDIISTAEMEIKNYRSNFTNYMEYMKSIGFPRLNTRPFIWLDM